MSRSGYSHDYSEEDPWGLIRYRGAVMSGLRGRRGQALLRDIAAFMDAMPEKILVEGELVAKDGCVCALGAAARQRGVDVSNVDPYDPQTVASRLNVSESLAREVTWINDECGHYAETPKVRWMRVRAWVDHHLKEESPDGKSD